MAKGKRTHGEGTYKKRKDGRWEAQYTIYTPSGTKRKSVYGREHADSYIEIHHVKPLSGHEGEVDPVTDLVPLCAYCHRMAHRRRTTVTSIDELKALIEEAAN